MLRFALDVVLNQILTLFIYANPQQKGINKMKQISLKPHKPCKYKAHSKFCIASFTFRGGAKALQDVIDYRRKVG